LKKKKRRKNGKRPYWKVIKIPSGVIEQIQQDVKGNSVRFYQSNGVPNVFIQKDLIHPEMFQKCIGVTVALSACCAENRNYMYLAGMRVDNDNGERVTDFDPIVMVSNIETGSQSPSGVVSFHSDYEGRTEIVEARLANVSVEELKREVSGKELTFNEASERLKNAMHYSAESYRRIMDKDSAEEE
jgi:hypothetical protein